MTAARATAPENPPPQPPTITPERSDHPRVRLAPGTRVTAMNTGVLRSGVVQRYEPQNTRGHDTFPVRFDHNGQWRMLNSDYVTVIGEAP